MTEKQLHAQLSARIDRIDTQLDRVREQLGSHAEIVAGIVARYTSLAEAQEILNRGIETRVKALERIAYKTTALWAVILFVCNAIGIIIVQFFIRHSTTP